ncbi:TPA: SAVED domain-containing protein [Klebsiella variicola subsp. variicola]
MANAVSAGWHGHDYQARFFWIKASSLRNPEQPFVIEVSYEADGPKAFDDVVIRYDPPRISSGAERISADFFQIKFHVTIAGRFGYEDLINPEFIGAESVSLLERLQQAKITAPTGSAFHLVTIDSLKDGDPLSEIISAQDHSLRLDKLREGKTDRSRMGVVRKLWREHLKLSTDQELYDVLKGFHIDDHQPSLEQLRQNVNLHFRVIGLLTCETNSEFKYDGAARALKSRGLYQFSREQFERLCVEEGWIRPEPPDKFVSVALRSFSDGPLDMMDAPQDRTLSLLQHFDDRFLSVGNDWETTVQPLVVEFLTRIKQTENRIRLFMDVHSSIAFLAGKCLGLKACITIELVQKGRAGMSVWCADEGDKTKGTEITFERVGDGDDIALVLSISRNALNHVKIYLAASQPNVGRIIHVSPEGGPGLSSVVGGAHAARIAEDIANAVNDVRVKFGANIHVFSAAPNAVNFYVGQQIDYMGKCIFYEFDFNRRIDGSYHQSIKVN